MTTVMNLSTQQKISYTCTPEQAVIAAYAQEHKDWNTWDYATRYGHMLERGKHTVLCGNWSAFYRTCHSLESGQMILALAGLLFILLALLVIVSLAIPSSMPAELRQIVNFVISLQ